MLDVLKHSTWKVPRKTAPSVYRFDVFTLHVSQIERRRSGFWWRVTVLQAPWSNLAGEMEVKAFSGFHAIWRVRPVLRALRDAGLRGLGTSGFDA
jgi:hypothetical protein